MKDRLFIQEVSVRDGFQIEPRFIPTEDKIRLINALSLTGLSKIEVTSFTSPRAIPALADAEVVMCEIDRIPGVIYAALVPNARGCERALDCKVDEINVFMSASASHNLANLRMTPEQSLAQFRAIAAQATGHAMLNASLSTAFGCPFEGAVPPELVLQRVGEFADMGMQGVSLCDTTGMANPTQVAHLCEAVLARWPELTVTVHFHDTRGMGLANALAAWQTGIRHFDASLGGLGGCPYAPGASGNVCTEDLVHMFQAMGCQTGVDLERLLAAAATLPALVGHELPGQLLKAGPSTRLHPLPQQA
ncbi:hydroxymethylglutaryl-CoA lyase [Pusillimonas sp. CC-YST705]|uniref:Hydroxymethylglutaryl-CoA lyase n=2 Tax=Mesopusillimonas faecipullorum TaxID=2755040 RepID=A0ABS8CE94_9BURK|nr:hydroxymethylglutaryl-CoA lyase [Mesopusillimonas faecipullorum]